MSARLDAENRRPAPWPSAEERAAIERFGMDAPETDCDRLFDAQARFAEAVFDGGISAADAARRLGHRRTKFIDDGDGIRAGFVILGVMVGGMALVALVIVGLVQLWGLPK